MSDTILVLGGAGFLGQHIIKELTDNNFSKVACADMAPANMKGALTFQVDILDYTALEEIVKHYDLIINCAGQITDPIHNSLLLNTKGMNNIVRAALKYNRKIVHISSVAVYGTSDFADENTPLNPETPYAALKAFSEYLITNSLPKEQYIILRLSNLFGKNQPKGIFGYLEKSYKTDKGLHFNNNGELRRYYLHVEDCSKFIVNLVRHQNISGIFNVRGPEKYSIQDLVHLFEKSANIHFTVHYEPSKPLENIQNLSDDKIKTIVGIHYQHSIENFIKKEFLTTQRPEKIK